MEDINSQQEEVGEEDEDTEESDLSEVAIFGHNYLQLHMRILVSFNQQKLSDLIVYCRSKRIRPWSWDEQKETSVCNMFSFNESTALTRCKDSSGM